MKGMMLDLMRASGAFAPFRLASRDKALVLMYHRFTADDGAPYETANDTTANYTTANYTSGAIGARAFRRHLAYLTKHYRVVPLSQLAAYLRRGERLPTGLAAITIDDGYADAYTVALPLLKEYSVPATLFVVTDFIDGNAWVWTDKMRFLTSQSRERWLEIGFDDAMVRLELGDVASRQRAASYVNRLLKTRTDEVKEQLLRQIAASLDVELPAAPPAAFAPLSWDEVQTLDAAGVEIGSHTVTHPILTQVTKERLRYEIHVSKARLQARLGRAVDLFCYPNGDYHNDAVREVERAGYACAVTTDYGFNEATQSVLQLRRLAAESDLSRFVQSTSGFEGARLKLNSRLRARHLPRFGRGAPQHLEA